MNERFKEVRKALKLSQDAFGERLGLKGSSVSYIESGRNALTEQNIKAICREFNVDYIWLTTGEGEMFTESDDQAMALIDRMMSGENDFARRVFKAFAALDENDWKMLKKFVDSVAADENSTKKEAD